MRRALLLVAVVLWFSTAASSRAQQLCVGDCDADGAVTVNELVLGVTIALGTAALASCSSFDCEGTGSAPIRCLVRGVGRLLTGCAATPKPTPTPTPVRELFTDTEEAALVACGCERVGFCLIDIGAPPTPIPIGCATTCRLFPCLNSCTLGNAFGVSGGCGPECNSTGLCVLD
jgi:hypothetical protein